MESIISRIFFKPYVRFVNVRKKELLSQVSNKSWSYVQTDAQFFSNIGENFHFRVCFEKLRKQKDRFALWRKKKLWHLAKILSLSPGIELQFQKASKSGRVPFLFSFFSPLMRTASYLKFNGQTFGKFFRAATTDRHLDNKNWFFESSKRMGKRANL